MGNVSFYFFCLCVPFPRRSGDAGIVRGEPAAVVSFLPTFPFFFRAPSGVTRALLCVGFRRGRGSGGGLHVLAAEQFPFVPLAGDSKQERAAGRAVSRWPQPREMSCGISIQVGIRLRRWQRHKARRGTAGEEEIIHGDSSCGWVIQGVCRWWSHRHVAQLHRLFVCCAGCKRAPKINPGLLDFCPVNYFQKGVTVFSGTHIVKFFSLQWASFQLVIYQPSILQDRS